MLTPFLIGLIIGAQVGAFVMWLVVGWCWRQARNRARTEMDLNEALWSRIDRALSRVTPKANATVKAMERILKGE